jgi:ankyrin repeat protein
MKQRNRIGRWVGWALPMLAVCAIGAAPREVPLVQAAKQNDVAAVRILLKKGANVSEAETDGTSALHWAVHRNNTEMVDVLLAARASATATNRYGVVPLSLACENGNPAIVERLLKAGANPNTVMPSGETAVMTAARSGNPIVLKLLIAAGADVNAPESTKQQTALMWASAANNTDAIKVLVEAGAKIDARSRPTLALSPAEPGDKGFTAVLFAARAGHLEAARTLLALGADVNDRLSDGTSALVLAAISAKYDMAVFLLDNGADPNAAGQGWTALHQLVFSRRPNQGLNTVGPVPRGRVDTLTLARKLIEKGANINARATKEMHTLYAGRNSLNRVGGTPFFLAAHRVDVEYMRFLLDHGADAGIPNEDGTTPLMVAAGVGLWSPGENPGTAEEAGEAVALCLKMGNDPNAIDKNGNSALHGAAFRGAPTAAQALVDAGARLDAKNAVTAMKRSSGAKATTGWTPLMVAEGIYINATFKSQAETAVLLRKLMKERGISTDYILDGQTVRSGEPPPH